MSLKIENIKKHYRIAGEKKTILQGINLEVLDGQIVSITGKSGCGKTTLLNIISGLTRPSEGSIFIDDKRITHWLDILSSRNRNQKMGFIFQTFRLLPNETVMSNILLPARINGTVNKQLKYYAGETLSKLKIYKYHNSKVGILSGGQKQRVAIARALINNPKVILADEPTANLDKKTSIDIFSILEDLKKEGKTILIITHKDYMHERSDIVYTMENGLLEELH